MSSLLSQRDSGHYAEHAGWCQEPTLARVHRIRKPLSWSEGLSAKADQELLGGPRGHLFLQLLLQGFEIEARALLHRRELEEGLRLPRDLVLDEHEAPELVREPVVVGQRPRETGALERIEAKVDEDGPVDLDRAAEPAVRLVDEPVLVVADAHRAQRGLGKVEDLPALRRALAGDQVRLVVAVQVHLVRAIAELLAGLQLFRDVRISRRGDEGGKPVEAGDELVLDPAGWHLARPAEDHRSAEAALQDRSLRPRERGLAAVGPGKGLGAVVGGEADDGV